MKLPLDMALRRAQACIVEGDREQALRLMEAAACAAPGDAAVHAGLGVALRFNGHLTRAASAFSRALDLQPNRADAQVYLGMVRLAQGRQKEGWALYQARWRYANWTEKLRYPKSSLWSGKITQGTRLLLWGEQGFGDNIQFVRFAPWLQRQLRGQGASLALEVPAPLCSLLRASWPFMDIFAFGETMGRFDAHLPLMDLPFRWGSVVGSGGLPYLPLPYLSALPVHLPEQVGTRRFPGDRRRVLKVGVVWQGRPSHPDDRWRSLRAVDLEPLFAVDGISWVSLQKEGAGHPAWLPDDLAQCTNFSDTARIVDALDLVISIDSAVAHLAAALGKPVWVLLPKIADWRWQLSGSSTPWYPNMHLFRQGADETWAVAVNRVAAALVTMAENRS